LKVQQDGQRVSVSGLVRRSEERLAVLNRGVTHCAVMPIRLHCPAALCEAGCLFTRLRLQLRNRAIINLRVKSSDEL
jgi:hypothetical protein